MSQTTYFLPVSFARFQDPSTRSDAPAGGAAAPQAGGAAGPTDGAAGTTAPTGQPQGPCANDGMLWMMPMKRWMMPINLAELNLKGHFDSHFSC